MLWVAAGANTRVLLPPMLPLAGADICRGGWGSCGGLAADARELCVNRKLLAPSERCFSCPEKMHNYCLSPEDKVVGAVSTHVSAKAGSTRTPTRGWGDSGDVISAGGGGVLGRGTAGGSILESMRKVARGMGKVGVLEEVEGGGRPT